MADRFDYVLNQWTALSGGRRPGFNNSVYLSERNTADRNFALGYFMRENRGFPKGVDLVETLEFYFQCCSIEVDVNSMSYVAASLANGGVCPTTGKKIFKANTVKHCLSLMHSCGMYDYSGGICIPSRTPCKEWRIRGDNASHSKSTRRCHLVTET